VKNFVITLLAILLLCFGGYFVYDKCLSKDEVNDVSLKDEYVLMDSEHPYVQFLYSFRKIQPDLNDALYREDYILIDDLDQEKKYGMIFNILGYNKSYLSNDSVKMAYELIFGPGTYTRPDVIYYENLGPYCVVSTYKYNEMDNAFFEEGVGCSTGKAGGVDERIDEVRRYNDRIEIRTSYYVIVPDTYFSSDMDGKNILAYYDEVDQNMDIFSEFKDKLSHMIYTYKLGEDGYYYYYSAKNEVYTGKS